MEAPDHQAGATTQHLPLFMHHFFTPTLNTDLLFYLWRCRSVPVTGEDLQRDASAAVFQHLLQLCGVVADILAIHLFNDVTHVEQALPVYHAAVEDPGNDQVIFFYTKGHALRGR